MEQIFDVEFLPLAEEYMENLDEKARVKVYYNIRKSQYVQDKELFKKLNETFGNLEHYLTISHTGYMRFGIIMKNKMRWLLPHTEFSKRLRKHRQKKLKKQRK